MNIREIGFYFENQNKIWCLVDLAHNSRQLRFPCVDSQKNVSLPSDTWRIFSTSKFNLRVSYSLSSPIIKTNTGINNTFKYGINLISWLPTSVVTATESVLFLEGKKFICDVWNPDSWSGKIDYRASNRNLIITFLPTNTTLTYYYSLDYYNELNRENLTQE